MARLAGSPSRSIPGGARFITYFRGGAKNMKTGRIFPDFGAESAKEAAE